MRLKTSYGRSSKGPLDVSVDLQDLEKGERLEIFSRRVRASPRPCDGLATAQAALPCSDIVSPKNYV